MKRLRLFMVLILVTITIGQRSIDDEDDDDGISDFAMNDASGDGTDDETWHPMPPDTKNKTDDDIYKEKSVVVPHTVVVQPATILVPTVATTEFIMRSVATSRAFVIVPDFTVVPDENDFMQQVTNRPTRLPHRVTEEVPMPIKPDPTHDHQPPPRPIAKDEVPTEEPPKTGGLSPGAIAGMIITSVIVLIVIIIVVICCKHKQQGYSRTQVQERV